MTENLLGIRAAAAALEVNASTVSRYLRRYPELNRGSDARPLINVVELRRHRAENVNIAMAGNHAGVPAATPQNSDAAEPETPLPPEKQDHSYSRARAAREAINARRAKIELDQILGAVTPTDEVNDAVFAANQVLQDGLLNIRRELAERLVGMTDVREIEALLRQEHRAVLEGFAQEFKRLFEREAQNAA